MATGLASANLNIEKGVIFGNSLNNVNMTFNRNMTVQGITIDSGFTFEDLLDDQAVTQDWSFNFKPSSDRVLVTVNQLHRTKVNITDTPSFLITVQHNITGYFPNSIIGVYRANVYQTSITSDSGGFCTYTSSNINTATNFVFIPYTPPATTTTTTTTIATTTTTTITTTTTTLTMEGMTPCLTDLSTGDVKEALKCIYVGENFQREDGVPTMGYWFYGIIVLGMCFIMYLKVKNITFVSIVLLLFMSILGDLFPPEGALTYWGIVVMAIAGTLYGLFKGGGD